MTDLQAALEPLHRTPMTMVASRKPEAQEPLVYLTVAERDNVLEAFRLVSGERDALEREVLALRADVDRESARAEAAEAALGTLLDEAEDVFVCMADATGIDRHNLPAPFVAARAYIVAHPQPQAPVMGGE